MPITLNSSDPKLQVAVLRAWSAGDNTADIAQLLDVAEPEIERILVKARDALRQTPLQIDEPPMAYAGR
jgi:DNA-directed RNA polymerase specialized sigma24 family protein